MSEKAAKAIEIFQTYNCAQSVFGACAPADGLDQKLCLMVAAAFGGGMARHGHTCGALTGALMTIGYRECLKGMDDPAALKVRVNARAGAFMDEFERCHGALTCRELTGCNLRTPEGQQQFKERDLHRTLCEKLITGAVEMLEQE